MSNIDKTTIKVRAYPGYGQLVAPQNTLTEEQNNALELVKKNAPLDEEKKKRWNSRKPSISCAKASNKNR